MYDYNIEKVANFIIYSIDNNVENFTKTKLMKLMFYSDKYHLQKYGRAIFGDDYYKLPHGPVPTLTLNIINSINEPDNVDLEDYVKKLSNYVSTSITYYKDNKVVSFNKTRDFDRDLFSQSEMDIFKKVINDFISTSASEISEISHSTPEYRNTNMQSKITYSNMAGSDMSDYIQFTESEYNSFEQMLKA